MQYGAGNVSAPCVYAFKKTRVSRARGCSAPYKGKGAREGKPQVFSRAQQPSHRLTLSLERQVGDRIPGPRAEVIWPPL